MVRKFPDVSILRKGEMCELIDSLLHHVGIINYVVRSINNTRSIHQRDMVEMRAGIKALKDSVRLMCKKDAV